MRPLRGTRQAGSGNKVVFHDVAAIEVKVHIHNPSPVLPLSGEDRGGEDNPPDKGLRKAMTVMRLSIVRGGEDDPPDKGGKGGYIPYNPTLVEKARENRKNPTPAEKKLWFEVLQNKRFADLKFTRQKPLDEYIADFYCAELMLVIEIDGDSHTEQAEYDEQRTARLNQLGIEVIRYTNREVLNNLEGVYSDLLERIRVRRQKLPKSPTP